MEILFLCDQFCEYSLSIKGYSKETIRRYNFVIKHFCKVAGISEIGQVTAENVRALFYHGRANRKWSANTFRVYHKSLLVFFRWCVKQGVLAANPVVDIEVPKLAKTTPKNLTKQDALRLLDVAANYPYPSKFLRYRNAAIFSTFVFAGLRKQELLNLKYGDVDIENMTIFIRQGKGSKDRIIPINYTLALALKKYLQERKACNKTCPEFFTSFNRNKGYTVNGLKRVVVEMNNAIGIKFSVHRLRHTFATLMLEGGCDIYNLSKMMGHSSIQTTTIYLSATVEHLRSQIMKHPLNRSYVLNSDTLVD